MGLFFMDFGKKVLAPSTAVCELLAIWEACIFVLARGLSNVLICGDNRSIILLSNSEGVPPWEISSITYDIRYMATRCGISFSFVGREENFVAHCIASFAQIVNLFRDCLSCPPLVLTPLFCSFFCFS